MGQGADHIQEEILIGVGQYRTACINLITALQNGYLPIILGRPFLLSEDGIVLPFTSPLIALPTLSLKPFGGLSLTMF